MMQLEPLWIVAPAKASTTLSLQKLEGNRSTIYLQSNNLPFLSGLLGSERTDGRCQEFTGAGLAGCGITQFNVAVQ